MRRCVLLTLKPVFHVYARAAVLAGLCALAACNTVHGFGEDLSTLGGKISTKAEQRTDKPSQP